MVDKLIPGAGPQFLAEPAGKTDTPGVLLLHDLGDTPQELELLAKALSNAGVSVELPLLPGHGTEISDLEETTWDDWVASAQLSLDELIGRGGPVVVGGIGMGATIAAWVGLDRPEVVGMIAINPRSTPVPAEVSDVLAAMLADGTSIVPPLAPDVSDRGAQVLGYHSIPVRTLDSMFRGVNDFAEHWSEITCPVLLISSARDHRVHPANAQWVADRLGDRVEHVELLKSFHLATLDVEHAELERHAISFVTRLTQ